MLTAIDSSVTISNLNRIAHQIWNDPSLVTADLMDEVEGYFDELVDYLWEMNPSEAPDHLIRTLENMPGEICEWFRNYLIGREKAIPPVGMFGTRIWLCAPSI